MKILSTVLALLFAAGTALAIPDASSDVIKAMFASKDFQTILEKSNFGDQLTINAKAINFRDPKKKYAQELCQDFGSTSRSGTVLEVKLIRTIFDTAGKKSVVTSTYFFATPGDASNVAACSFDVTSKNP